MEVKKGEFLGIMGPNGSGKSSLLNIIGLLDMPSTGEYLFHGKSIFGLKEETLSDYHSAFMGFVFQENQLAKRMTVFKNIEAPLIKRGVTSHERRIKVTNLLERFNLVEKKDHFPQQLSFGQQRCVAIARAVVANPALIVADEPTNNLDSDTRLEVMNLLTELNREGTTIVMASHSPHDSDFAGRSVHLSEGQIISGKVKDPIDEKLFKLFAPGIYFR